MVKSQFALFTVNYARCVGVDVFDQTGTRLGVDSLPARFHNFFSVLGPPPPAATHYINCTNMAISSLSRFFPGISIRINRAHRHDYLLIGRLLRGMAQFKRHFTGRYLARGTGKPDLLGMGDEDPRGPEIGARVVSRTMRFMAPEL